MDIEREITREHEWTHRVLEGEPTVEQDHPMPAVEELLSPLTPLTPEPSNDIEDLYGPQMDIDMMIHLGHHYILNQIMKQAVKPMEGIPYHYKDILKCPVEE